MFIQIGTEPIRKHKTRKMKNIGLEHVLIAGVVGYFAYQHFFKKKAASAPSNGGNSGGTSYPPQVPSEPGQNSIPSSGGGNVSRGPSKPSTGSGGGSTSTGSDGVTTAPMRGVGGLNSSFWNKGTGPTWGLGGCDYQMGWL